MLNQGKLLLRSTRLVTEPDRIASLLTDHIDSLDTFDELSRDGRCVKDRWSML